MIIKILVAILIIVLDLLTLVYLCYMLSGKNQEASDFRIKNFKLDAKLEEFRKQGYEIPRLHSHYEDTSYDIRDFSKEVSLHKGMKSLSDEEKENLADLVTYFENYRGLKIKKNRYRYTITRCDEKIAYIYILKNKVVFKTNFNKYYFVRERGTVDPVVLVLSNKESFEKAKEDIRMILA